MYCLVFFFFFNTIYIKLRYDKFFFLVCMINTYNYMYYLKKSNKKEKKTATLHLIRQSVTYSYIWVTLYMRIVRIFKQLYIISIYANKTVQLLLIITKHLCYLPKIDYWWVWLRMKLNVSFSRFYLNIFLFACLTQ